MTLVLVDHVDQTFIGYFERTEADAGAACSLVAPTGPLISMVGHGAVHDRDLTEAARAGPDDLVGIDRLGRSFARGAALDDLVLEISGSFGQRQRFGNIGAHGVHGGAG